jgi:hypothetical protein
LTSSRTQAVVIQGTAVTKGVWYWGDNVSRWVDALDVEPGQYQFHARILSPVPQLVSIPMRLKLWTILFKMSSSWQSSVLFWGALLTVWIVTPAAVFSVAWLIGRVGGYYLRSGMATSRTGK